MIARSKLRSDEVLTAGVVFKKVKLAERLEG